MVLQSTIRNYLISTVEENTDKIRYVDDREDTDANIYIPYEDGFLEIDLDFMEVIQDVHTALYTEDGRMLYGENPLSRQMPDVRFEGTYLWNTKYDNVQYDIYDRCLAIDLPDGRALWIRGIVPESRELLQLKDITRLLLIILPFLALLSILSGSVMIAKLLSPLQRIENAAEKISAGEDLSKRIDHGPNNDEIGRLARAFNMMLNRLEHSFETERQFTSDVSHELRTPATVILTQSEYILEKERGIREYTEAFQTVQKQAERMSALIEDMLSYTRIDQRPELYPFEALSLSQIVKEVIGQPVSEENKGITVSAELTEDIKISGNPELVRRLIQNLLSNAYRYGRENGHIWITLHSDNGKAVLTVKDDGIGIEEASKERIFDRFYRGDASRTVQGTGLGLSIVKRISEIHKAEILVESELNIGSTFRILWDKV